MKEPPYASNQDMLLFSKLQDGDRTAFDLLFRKYYPILCSYGCHFVTPEDAEEIVQDVFLWIWENRDRLLIDYSLKHYLFRMVHHRSLNKVTQDEVKLRAYTAYHERMMEALNDFDVVQIYELSRHIDQAINELPPLYRQAFVMHRFRGLSHKEIATQLNVSPQTVNYRIGQAVKQLRIRLKDYLPFALLLLSLR